AVLDPERLVEPVAEGDGALTQPGRELGVVPDDLGQLCCADPRVVRVPLHLGRCDRGRRQPAGAEALRVAAVLPGLISGAIGCSALVLAEAVAVAVAVVVDPRERGPGSRLELLHDRSI